MLLEGKRLVITGVLTDDSIAWHTARTVATGLTSPQTERLSDEVLTGGAEAKLTELSNDDLLALVSLDLQSAVAS